NALGFRNGNGPRQRDGAWAHRLDQVVAGCEGRQAAGLEEIGIGRGTRGEGVAFVQEAADGDPHPQRTRLRGVPPASAVVIPSSTIRPIASRVSTVALPRCGSSTTFS